MPHPTGGQGNTFPTHSTFDEIYEMIGEGGLYEFRSFGNERIVAVRGYAQDRITPTIVFTGERNKHGNVCPACWGYRKNCTATRIGQCVESLDTEL